MIEKCENGKRIAVENLNQLDNLILTNFLSVEDVVETFEQVIAKMDDGEIKPNSKVELHLFQHRF